VDDLKVVELGLVPIYEDKEARKLVNARKLHTFLGSKQEFAHWIKDRIEKYGFVEGEDYLIILSNRAGDGIGKPKTDYFLVIDVAKELSMVENNEQGRRVRRYFIECEKRLKANSGVISAKDAEKLKRDMRHLAIMERNSRNRQAWILKSTAEFFKAILSDTSMRTIASEITLLLAGKRLVELPDLPETSEVPETPKVPEMPITPQVSKVPETSKVLKTSKTSETLYSAAEIGEMCGIDANTVGRIANEHGLKTKEYGEIVPSKSPDGSKQSTFQYKRKVAGKIKEIFNSTIAKHAEERTPRETAKT
jgi:phage anti-repressor protein